MIERSINATTLLLAGIILIAIGICMLLANQLTLQLLLSLFGVLTIFLGGFSICKSLWNDHLSKNDRILSILPGIRDFIVGAFVLSCQNFILHSLAICFGFYLLLHTVIDGIEYFIYRKYKIKGRLRIILAMMFQLLFLIPLLFNLEQNIQVTSIIIGIYLIGYGVTRITDFLTILIPKRETNRIKQQIQIPLPVILNAFIPRRLITLVNEMLEVKQDTELFDYQKQSETPDLYVLIHLAKGGTAAMGHMEIAYQNKIYSYGNYDMHSRSLFDAIGDGVVVVANQKKYIRYMVQKKERYIVEFGLTLTEKEKQVVEKQLNKLIMTNTEPYYPDLQKMEQGSLPKGEYTDMSSEIYRDADGKFYKITKGKYKKFFVLKTNCAMVAQYVLSSIGKQILCVNGIITPGAYYDYLNERLKLKNTNVIRRKVYTKENFKEEFYGNK